MNSSYTRISRQAKRVRGCDVYISSDRKGSGWNLKRSKWALPVEIAKLPLEERHQQYKAYIIDSGLIHEIPELAHQLLGCWCDREDSCHVQVLRELLQDYESTHTAAHEITDDVPTISIRRAPIYQIGVKPARQKKAVVRPTTSVPIVVPPPLPFDETEFIEITRVKQSLTKGCISKMKNGTYTTDGWPQFVCRVCKVARNKKTGRFSLTLTDEWEADAAENPKKHLKVELGSQLFEAIKLRFIKPDDVVRVIYYAITNLTPPMPEVEGDNVVVRQTKPKYFYFVTSLKKIVVENN